MKRLLVTLLFILFVLAIPGYRENTLASPPKNPVVLISTDQGDIEVEVYVDRAPITANNFLEYVKQGLYNGACFYRVVTMDNQPHNDIKIEVIQGGLDHCSNKQALPPIEHETTKKTGINHLDGTISMARTEPGTADSEFFICVNDQPDLDYGGMRNPDGQGFAAFGRVIKGMDIVRKIQALPNTNQMLNQRVIISEAKILKP